MKLTDQQKKALIKRSADILEKMSIASFAVGVFQGQQIGIWTGIASLIVCMTLTLSLEK